MSNFGRLGTILQAVLLFIIATSQVFAASNQVFRSYWHPKFLSERLSYCSLDGTQCGKKVADQYCKMLGYRHSSQSSIAYNLGLTNYLSSRAQCKGWRCNGFMTIDCVTEFSHKPPRPYHYREKKYVYPRFNEYRIDWCYNKNTGCGKRAANSFCSRMGFTGAKGFAKEPLISATKTIGSQELCFGNECDAFRFIVCNR